MNTSTVFLIGMGLAMDAFAIFLCQGIIQMRHNKKNEKDCVHLWIFSVYNDIK